MHKRNHELIDIKIRQYLIPAVMMKLALQLGNIVDTMLVGNLLGTRAMSAVSLSIPALSLIQIPGFFLGNGGAITASILLGRRQKQDAKEIFTATFSLSLFFDLLFLLSAFFITDPLAHLLAGGGTMEQDVASYVFVCLVGAPVLGLGLLLSSFFAADSHPQLASAYFIIANVVNLALDYIFLKYTSLGVTGAALSTILGFAAGLVVTVPYLRSKKRMLSFTAFRITWERMNAVAKAGMPHLSLLLVRMGEMFLMNRIVLSLLGESGIVIFTVCINTGLILAMLIGGVMGVIPNIAGILYGEKDYYGIHALFKKIVRYGTALAGALMILVLVFTRFFTVLFGVTEPTLQDIMVMVLRIYVFSMPFNMWNFFGTQYYGSVEKSALATLITVLQNGVFLIPAALAGILVGQRTGGNGYLGLALAFIISEGFTVLASFLYRRIKYPGQSVLLIPDDNPGEALDFTIRAEETEGASVPREVKAFCEKHSVDSRNANMIAVAAEEMVTNIIRYGGKASEWIDICLTVEEPGTDAKAKKLLMLRLRDNGVPFDPTVYEYDTEETDFRIHGIELARKAAKEITYVRAMDLNNTTLTVEA